jgi:hemerythrin superfamily protein
MDTTKHYSKRIEKMGDHKFLLHLKKDHKEQESLAKKLIKTKSPKERNKLRQQFYNSLYPHMVGEEASIFQLLTKAEDEDVRDDGLESLQEHHVGKFLLQELMELDTQSEVFKAKTKVLDELNRHHIKEEEKDIFGHLKKICDDGQMNKLFKKYEKAEKKAKA